MTRRTPTEQPTDTPTLHGHYDGAHGHQDEHRHSDPPGDKDHGHPRGDRHLVRGAGISQYVPQAQLPDARAKMADAARRVAGLADDSTDPGPTTALATRDGHDGQTGAADATVAGFVTRLAHLAEHDRFANAFSYQVKTVIACSELLAQAEQDLAERRLIDPATARELRLQVSGLVLQFGDRDGGDGS